MQMTGYECESCHDLRQIVPIGNMRQLHKTHRVVMGNINDGTIFEVEHPTKAERAAIVKNLLGVHQDPDPPAEDFATLLESDGLPDIILHYFRCSACNLLFEYSVNTYHGSGGEWRPVFDEDLV